MSENQVKSPVPQPAPPTTGERLSLPFIACMTVGLAPFLPEPHIWGKLRWVAGGAVGMGALDWFDFLMHGAPWVWLFFEAGRVAAERIKAGRAD